VENRGIHLHFKGESIEGKDVYNPTAPFIDKNVKYIAARVESRDSETDSKVMFFKNGNNDVWDLDSGLPTFDLQDPFITRINDKLVFGGVKTFYKENSLYWKTVFYRGADISSLEQFAESPTGMKDIRLVELPDGKIGIFTRLQRGEYGLGKIGFKTINALEDLALTDFYDAHILEIFSEGQWGGANELHHIGNGTIGVLGHLAYFSQDKKRKHYSAITFTFDYHTLKASDMKLIARRSDFPKGPSKRFPELEDVVFPGGLIIQPDYAELYVGLSDTQAGKIRIPYPF